MEKAVALTTSRRNDLDRMFWALAAVGLLLFGIVTIPPGARRSRALSVELRRATAVHTRLQSKEKAFVQYERALKTDPFLNEAALRGKMKYRKPGEKVIQTGAAVFAPVLTREVGEYIPSRPAMPSLRRQIANWALLLASALLIAAAFIFFDGPSFSPRPGRTRSSHT